jgi:superoxide dismutase, Cu-Zn family
MRPIGVVMMLCVLGGCVGAPSTVVVPLVGTPIAPDVFGTVTLSSTEEGLRVVAQVNHVQAGEHGFHIHAIGNCGHGGQDAGGHFNPDGMGHGYLPRDGMTGAHAGDLGNITVPLGRPGTMEITVPQLTLGPGPYSVMGKAIILHADGDDLHTQPTGGAGARIACGVIAP